MGRSLHFASRYIFETLNYVIVPCSETSLAPAACGIIQPHTAAWWMCPGSLSPPLSLFSSVTSPRLSFDACLTVGTC